MIKTRQNPELLFWCAALIFLGITAGFAETAKMIFLGVVGLIWAAILVSSKWSGQSLLSFVLFALAWIWIWKA
jgi:hypothetical protein